MFSCCGYAQQKTLKSKELSLHDVCGHNFLLKYQTTWINSLCFCHVCSITRHMTSEVQWLNRRTDVYYYSMISFVSSKLIKREFLCHEFISPHPKADSRDQLIGCTLLLRAKQRWILLPLVCSMCLFCDAYDWLHQKEQIDSIVWWKSLI
mgnify:CR=1 FL=1